MLLNFLVSECLYRQFIVYVNVFFQVGINFCQSITVTKHNTLLLKYVQPLQLYIDKFTVNCGPRQTWPSIARLSKSLEHLTESIDYQFPAYIMYVTVSIPVINKGPVSGIQEKSQSRNGLKFSNHLGNHKAAFPCIRILVDFKLFKKLARLALCAEVVAQVAKVQTQFLCWSLNCSTLKYERVTLYV